MNGTADARTLALYGVLAAIISLGLLIFAYFASDTGVTDVVIGAVTGFWLREATYLGKAVTTAAIVDTNSSSPQPALPAMAHPSATTDHPPSPAPIPVPSPSSSATGIIL